MMTLRKTLSQWWQPVAMAAVRVAVGALFLFSGFVKAVDPQGMALKFNVYLAHWGRFISPDAIWLKGAAVALATVEFLIGIYLILGMRRRTTQVLALVFVALMTGLTVWIYIANPVSDCGCFGEALTLSHGQTLAKNIVLLVALAALLAYRGWPLRFITKRRAWLASMYSWIYIIGIGLASLHYLPPIDFTPYKTGISLREATTFEAKTTYLCSRGAEQREFDALPRDTTWQLTEWHTEVVHEANIVDFSLFNLEDEEDKADEVMADTGYVFLLAVPWAETADEGTHDRLNFIFDYCQDTGLRFIGASASAPAAVNEWRDRTGAAYTIYWAEEDMLRSLVRSNPGLVLLHDSRIVAKWSLNEFPENIEAQPLAALAQQRTGLRPFAKLLLWYFVPLLLIIAIDRLIVGSKFYQRYKRRKHIVKQP